MFVANTKTQSNTLRLIDSFIVSLLLSRRIRDFVCQTTDVTETCAQLYTVQHTQVSVLFQLCIETDMHVDSKTIDNIFLVSSRRLCDVTIHVLVDHFDDRDASMCSLFWFRFCFVHLMCVRSQVAQ